MYWPSRFGFEVAHGPSTDRMPPAPGAIERGERIDIADRRTRLARIPRQRALGNGGRRGTRVECCGTIGLRRTAAPVCGVTLACGTNAAAGVEPGKARAPPWL
jgi:hypothetical protein